MMLQRNVPCTVYSRHFSRVTGADRTRERSGRGTFLFCVVIAVLCGVNEHGVAADRPNVLLIAIDDLRSPFDCEVLPDLQPPTLLRLAQAGRHFTRHYVHVPTCGASRCALLRGRYPDKAAHLGNAAIRNTHADWAEASLPAMFNQHGYRTWSLGKITHYPGGLTGGNWDSPPEELPGVWDRCWIPETPWGAAQNMMHGFAGGVPRNRGQSPPMEFHEGPDSAYPDAWVADEAIRALATLRDSDAPWFLAVGFFKPHLPFAAPATWKSLVSEHRTSEPRAAAKPEGVSSWHGSGEFRGNYGHGGRDPEGDPRYSAEVRSGYEAATYYMDHQVGRLIAALEEQGLAEDTIIIVWSDHGFLLGEHAIWGKHCLYEESLRSPLIVIAPQVEQPGTPCHALVETVDVFPTLAELCDLAVPESLSGRSLLPMLRNPDAGSEKPARSFKSPQQRTLRTDRWRLILHTDRAGDVVGTELFDYENDPYETTNVAEHHPDVIGTLSRQLTSF